MDGRTVKDTYSCIITMPLFCTDPAKRAQDGFLAQCIRSINYTK